MNERVKVTQLLTDWRWRLSNLYHITDKDGMRVQFKMNWAQESLYSDMHYMNVILKARQLGMTTFIQIFQLDACIFNADIRAGTIAHTLEDAQRIFRDKVKYPYDNLPEALRASIRDIASNKTELELSNNSSIRVGTSLRSGTLQYLHISEYGKLCAKFPEKAREVRTGALNTVQSGQIVFIESTAEGQEGHYFDLCEAAKTKARQGSKLTPLDFKFHFYPWWKEPQYAIPAEGVVIPAEYDRYFDKLFELGIELTDEQEAWYVKKAETQLEDMKREYPSTPEEAFEASVEGAYYATQMSKADLDGRIGDFQHLPDRPVYTCWDIGHHDETAIWFFQILQGRIRWINYYANSGEVMTFYVKMLAQKAAEFGYSYKTHYVPHDARVVEWGGNGLQRIENMIDAMRELNIGRPEKVPDHGVEDRHNAVRLMLAISEIDEAHCSEGIKSLRNYRKDWDEEHGIWRNVPRKGPEKHGADSFGYGAMVYRELKAEIIVPKPAGLIVGTNVSPGFRLPSFTEVMAAQQERPRGGRI